MFTATPDSTSALLRRLGHQFNSKNLGQIRTRIFSLAPRIVRASPVRGSRKSARKILGQTGFPDDRDDRSITPPACRSGSSPTPWRARARRRKIIGLLQDNQISGPRRRACRCEVQVRRDRLFFRSGLRKGLARDTKETRDLGLGLPDLRQDVFTQQFSRCTVRIPGQRFFISDSPPDRLRPASSPSQPR